MVQTTRVRSLDFRLLAGFVVLLFLTAGGSRADMATLVVIRPLAIALAVYWAVRLDRERIAANRWFFVFAAITLGLALLHVVPLPPALWQAVPGRALIAEIDDTVGLGSVWRPLTLAPDAAWNALWSLSVPLAAGLGMAHLDAERRRAMLPIILACAALALGWSLLQSLAPSASVLWPYRITNSGSPTGLFANRNHNAVFLAAMVPLVTAWAVGSEAGKLVALRRALAVACGVLTIVVVLISGSRAGVVALAVAIAGALVLIPLQQVAPSRAARKGASPRAGWAVRQVALGALVVTVPIVLLVVGAMAGDTGAVGRLTDSGTGDFRPAIWRTSADLVWSYLPLGSGLGSFVEAYLIGESPRDMMAQYVNHAHNDYLEIALTLGIPGVLLIAAFLAFFGRRAWAVWRTAIAPGNHIRLARASMLAIAVFVGASVVDYPLRVPSLAAAVVIALFWLNLPTAQRGSARQPYGLPR